MPPLLLVVTGLLELLADEPDDDPPEEPLEDPLEEPEVAWLPLVRVVTGAELWLVGADEAGALLPEETCEPLERVVTAPEPA